MDETTKLLLANILSLIGNVIATSAAVFRAKKRVLLFQSANHVLEIVSQFLTKAYSGVTQEGISLIRNVLFVFVKTTKKLPKLIISLLCLVAGLALGIFINVRFGGNVWYGYLPIAGAAVYAVFVIVSFLSNAEESLTELFLKIGLVFNAICWSAYGAFVELYPVLIFNAVAFVLSVISGARILRARRAERKAKLASLAEGEKSAEE